MLKRRDGFTLVELLIVVVIIGILAAIALPKLTGTREGAYRNTLQSDLRNLASAMEIWYSNHGDFTYDGADEAALEDAGLFSKSGDRVSLSITADGQGWSASATHEAAPGLTCAIFAGTADPVAPAEVSGVVSCENA